MRDSLAEMSLSPGHDRLCISCDGIVSLVIGQNIYSIDSFSQQGNAILAISMQRHDYFDIYEGRYVSMSSVKTAKRQTWKRGVVSKTGPTSPPLTPCLTSSVRTQAALLWVVSSILITDIIRPSTPLNDLIMSHASGTVHWRLLLVRTRIMYLNPRKIYRYLRTCGVMYYLVT